MSTAAATQLAPVRITRRARRFTRSGMTRPEVWGAVTVDGQWGIERQDDVQTIWYVSHLPSLADGSWDRPVLVETTRRACQAAIADGRAALTLAMLRCEHSRDDRRFRFDPQSGLWREDCTACQASRVWHVECRQCEILEGHDWMAGRALAVAA